MDQLPFEIIYEIHEFVDTCEDSQSFRQTCRFFNLLKPHCDHHCNITKKRTKWMSAMFGSQNGQTLIQRLTKPKMPGNLFAVNQNLVCVFGNSKKSFQFALNELSCQNHVGGVVFGKNDEMGKMSKMGYLLEKYSPSCSFLKFDQLERYVKNLHKVERTMTRDERGQRSYVIIVEDDCEFLGKPEHRQLLMNGRHYYTDLLLYFPNIVRLGPDLRCQFDVFIFKKTKKVSDDDALKFFQNFVQDTHHIFDLYQKTFKTNFVLRVIGIESFQLVDISESLFESFLSDKIFWHQMHRKKM